jgi:glyoxylase-like metal-dependent hydrolase (beta-lactamase superfamily II)
MSVMRPGFAGGVCVCVWSVRGFVESNFAPPTWCSTAFFVEPDRVILSGDVVMSALPGFGSPSSRLSTWLGSLDRFEALAPVRIVPSHGPMGDATMIAGYRTFLTTVQARTVALKREGKTLEETVAVVQDELQRTYDRNRMAGAIRAAFNEAP